jgi:hypothetical protein
MKLEFRKDDKILYGIVGIALLFIIALYLYHSQKNTVEKFVDPNKDELDLRYEEGGDDDIDPTAECKKNLDSFLKKYNNFKIVGAWAPNGVPVKPFQIDETTVVFIGKDGVYFKMIGFNFCEDPIQRIKGKAVGLVQGLFEDMEGLDETGARTLWKKSTSHDNIGPGLYDLDYDYISTTVKVQTENGPPYVLSDESCKNIFDGYKKNGSKLYGTYIPGGVTTTLYGVVEDNGKEIVVFAGYHDGYYKMVGYDFCQYPPKRIDGRAKKTKKFSVPHYADARFISDFWNSAEHKGIKEGNYKLHLEANKDCSEKGGKPYYYEDKGEWACKSAEKLPPWLQGKADWFIKGATDLPLPGPD